MNNIKYNYNHNNFEKFNLFFILFIWEKDKVEFVIESRRLEID